MPLALFRKNSPRAVDNRTGKKVRRTDAEQVVYNELIKRWDPAGSDGYHQAFQREWWLSLAYLAGHQWAEWDSHVGELRVPDEPAWRVRYVANRIWPMTLRAHAALVAEKTSLRAAPAKATTESRNAASLADKVYEWAQVHTGFEECREEALLWAVSCGTGFVKCTWNANLGGEKTVMAQGQTKVLRLGDVEIDSASPFQIRFPAYIGLWRHLPWIVQVTLRPMEYVYERWPDKIDEITPIEAAADGLQYEHSVSSLVGKLGSVGGIGSEAYANCVKVVELWTKPFVAQTENGTKQFRKGLHAIVANDVVVQHGENPYHELGFHIPYVPYFYGVLPGRLWGMGLIEQLRAPQYHRNLARSQVEEHKNLMSFGKWLAPRGHGVPKSGFTSEPGEVIEYNPALPKPEMVAPPPLPAYVLDSVALTDAEMQDIAAQQDATEGKAPASVRSGVAIQLLQEKDRAVLAIPRKRLWRSDRDAGSMMLRIIQAKYIETRTLSIVGPGNVFEVQDFSGADLKDQTELRIFAESGLFDSRAARQQTIMDLLQVGLLDPKDPEQRKALFRMLELGEVRDYVSRMAADERIAEIENQAMLGTNGEPPVIPPVNWFDDDGVHIAKHDELLKSPTFLAMDPSLQAAISAHVKMHHERLAQRAAAMVEQEKQTRGTPGEKGKASQPGSGTRGGSPGGDDSGGGKSDGDSDG